MINTNHLEELDSLGFGSDIEALENYVESLQDSMADGVALVDDPVYDQHFRLLEALKPASPLLSRNWEKDGEEELQDYDALLIEHPMMSIKTATKYDDVDKYFEKLRQSGKKYVDMFVSYKMNGHASRVVYKYGELVSGTPRGRHKKGRDITRQFKQILKEKLDFFESFPLVEIRGELIVSYTSFLNVLSQTLKTPLSSVTSLVRDSVTNEELKYLEFIAYGIFIRMEDGTEMEFGTVLEMYDYLEACGFKVPLHEVIHGVDLDDSESFTDKVLEKFSDENRMMNYDTDGLVVSVLNRAWFNSMGSNGNRNVGNLAIKMGCWECNKYAAVINNIVWERGKKWFTPKAEIEPTRTADGKTVYVVPLYNLGVLIKLGLKVGATLNFRFGGETGVQLLTPDGKSVTTLD